MASIRNLLFSIYCLYTVGCANQNYSTVSNQPSIETCRNALFPLPGVRPGITFDSKESLYICLTNPGTSAVTYQIYVNGKKAFKVTPDEAKHFKVFISNTYSVSCSDPREKNSSKNVSALPKIDTPEIDTTSYPICIVSSEINNSLVRAAFVFDAIDRAHAPAIFELISEERQKYDALKAVAGGSGCLRPFNQDGSPTECLKQYEQEKRECPSLGQSCFDPALVGAWIQKVDEGRFIPKSQKLIPGIRGWIVRPNGVVRPLAIDFKTGKLAEGPKDSRFSQISYGCNGELYQETFVWLAGGFSGTYCGRYKFVDKSLGISRTKSDGFQYYMPTTVSKKFLEPINFTFDARLGEQSLLFPHVATELPAYAIATESSTGRRLLIRAFNDLHKIYISIPKFSSAEKDLKKNVGTVRIEVNGHWTPGFNSINDPMDPNKFTIDMYDTTKGRISGHFIYAVSSTNKSLSRFEGRFDIPLYLHGETPGSGVK